MVPKLSLDWAVHFADSLGFIKADGIKLGNHAPRAKLTERAALLPGGALRGFGCLLGKKGFNVT